jgi:hypothetical protein
MDEKKSYELKLDQETVKNNKMIEENSEKAQQLRLKREDIERLRAERDKVVKLHDMLKRKEKSLEEERKELEGNRNGIKQDIKQMQEKLDSMGRDADSDKKKIEDLLRERDILNKNVIKADERTKKQIGLGELNTVLLTLLLELKDAFLELLCFLLPTSDVLRKIQSLRLLSLHQVDLLFCPFIGLDHILVQNITLTQQIFDLLLIGVSITTHGVKLLLHLLDVLLDTIPIAFKVFSLFFHRFLLSPQHVMKLNHLVTLSFELLNIFPF